MSKTDHVGDQDYIEGLLRERYGRKGERLKNIDAELKRVGYETTSLDPVEEKAVKAKPKPRKATPAEEKTIVATVEAEKEDDKPKPWSGF